MADSCDVTGTQLRDPKFEFFWESEFEKSNVKNGRWLKGPERTPGPDIPVGFWSTLTRDPTYSNNKLDKNRNWFECCFRAFLHFGINLKHFDII